MPKKFSTIPSQTVNGAVNFLTENFNIPDGFAKVTANELNNFIQNRLKTVGLENINNNENIFYQRDDGEIKRTPLTRIKSLIGGYIAIPKVGANGDFIDTDNVPASITCVYVDYNNQSPHIIPSKNIMFMSSNSYWAGTFENSVIFSATNSICDIAGYAKNTLFSSGEVYVSTTTTNENNIFENCTIRPSLNNTKFKNCKFINCSIVSANNLVSFEDCDFLNCRIDVGGTMKNCEIISSTLLKSITFNEQAIIQSSRITANQNFLNVSNGIILGNIFNSGLTITNPQTRTNVLVKNNLNYSIDENKFRFTVGANGLFENLIDAASYINRLGVAEIDLISNITISSTINLTTTNLTINGNNRNITISASTGVSLFGVLKIKNANIIGNNSNTAFSIGATGEFGALYVENCNCNNFNIFARVYDGDLYLNNTNFINFQNVSILSFIRTLIANNCIATNTSIFANFLDKTINPTKILFQNVDCNAQIHNISNADIATNVQLAKIQVFNSKPIVNFQPFLLLKNIGNATATTLTAQNTWYPIVFGSFTLSSLKIRFQSDLFTILEAGSNFNLNVRAALTITVTAANTNIEVGIMKNGVIDAVQGVLITAANTPVSLSISTILINTTNNDNISIVIRRTSAGASNATVVNSSVNISVI